MSTEQLPPTQAKEECFSCKIIGSAAFGGIGIYALQMSRAKAPGSIVGKRIMGGVGICESFPGSNNFFLDRTCRLFGGECCEMVQIIFKEQNIILILFPILFRDRSSFVQLRP